MKTIQQGIFMLALAAGLSLTSCGDDNPWTGSDSEGSITLDLKADNQVFRGKTRADDTQCPIVPDQNAFGVKLTNADGSYTKNWSSVEAFNRETSFPMGDYTLTATYGDVDKEGFELPCFKGTASVHVSPGQVTNAEMTATLANAMVSVRYTDKFVAAVQAYSAGVQTEGHDWVIFAQNESRPAFVNADGTEPVNLSITMTNRNGKTVTVSPANFKIQPRHHYVVTIDANGNQSTGDLTLNVEFDDEVINETVNIPLGDELFTAPAPSIMAKNFTDKEQISKIELDNIATNPQFDIFAFGGFKEVTLNVITTDGVAPAFGKSVQLVNAETLTQQQLANEGVKVSGLFRNVDKMAVVNIKNYVEGLAPGTYTIQLQATDAMTRLSEPVELTVKVDKLEIEIASAKTLNLYDTEVTVDVATNSAAIKDRMSFKLPNSNNQMVNATVKSVTDISAAASGKRTRAGLPYTFRYVLESAPIMSASVDARCTWGNKSNQTKDVVIAVAEPQYTVETDAFARFVAFKVSSSTMALESLVNNLKFYNGSNEIPAGNIKRDASTGIITIAGLNPAVEYKSMKAVLGAFNKEIPAFTTESENDVPNGNFATQGFNLKFGNIKSGGKFGSTSAVEYQFTTSINIFEPQDWATLNSFTCYSGSTNKNTWFMVPSTFVDNGSVIIRSVGYSHNGTDPSASHYAAPTYCKNAPAQLDVAAGELFLGTYSYDGSEHKVKGTAFASRPISVSFDYKYTPLNGEQAQADVEVLDNAGNVLASSTVLLSAASNMANKTINIDKYIFGKKAAKLYVRFRSTKEGVTPNIYKPTGEELRQPGNTGWSSNISENAYKAFAKGSELTVDNVKVSYSGVPTITK